jgi:hypothetical protein
VTTQHPNPSTGLSRILYHQLVSIRLLPTSGSNLNLDFPRVHCFPVALSYTSVFLPQVPPVDQEEEQIFSLSLKATLKLFSSLLLLLYYIIFSPSPVYSPPTSKLVLPYFLIRLALLIILPQTIQFLTISISNHPSMSMGGWL